MNELNINERLRDLERNQNNIPVRVAAPPITNRFRWAVIDGLDETGGKYSWTGRRFSKNGIAATDATGSVADGNFAMEIHESDVVIPESIVRLERVGGIYVFEYAGGTYDAAPSEVISTNTTGAITISGAFVDFSTVAYNGFDVDLSTGQYIKVGYSPLNKRWDIISADCEA